MRKDFLPLAGLVAALLATHGLLLLAGVRLPMGSPTPEAVEAAHFIDSPGSNGCSHTASRASFECDGKPYLIVYRYPGGAEWGKDTEDRVFLPGMEPEHPGAGSEKVIDAAIERWDVRHRVRWSATDVKGMIQLPVRNSSSPRLSGISRPSSLRPG